MEQHPTQFGPQTDSTQPDQTPGRPMGYQYEPPAQTPPQGPSKALIAICAAGLGLASIGLARSMFFAPEKAEATNVVREPSPWQQQQEMMRDALNMAREAAELQRQHQADMRRMMEMESAGYEGFDR